MRDEIDNLSQMKSLEWDSPDWRKVRDRQLNEWIGDDHAVRFFLDFLRATPPEQALRPAAVATAALISNTAARSQS